MKVIILRGISGSGKTMLATDLQLACGGDMERSLTVSADNFWEMGHHEYKFDVTKIDEAHADCLLRFMSKLKKWAALVEGHLLIVDNTNTRAVEVAPYYALAEAYGAAVRVITIICDLQLALESNTHDTPAKILWAQHQRILNEQLPSWWKHEVAFRIHEPDGVDLDEITYQDGVVFDAEELLKEMDEA